MRKFEDAWDNEAQSSAPMIAAIACCVAIAAAVTYLL